MKNKVIAVFTIACVSLSADTLRAQWVPTNGPDTGPTVYAFASIGNNLFAGTDAGVFVSTNNGIIWGAPYPGLTNQVTALLVDSNDLIAASLGTIYRSSDNGSNWVSVDSANFTPANAYAFSLAKNGSTLFALIEEFGLGNPAYTMFHSTDNGISWVSADTSFPYGPYLDVFSMAVSGNAVFIGTSSGVYRSKDSAVSWMPANSSLANDQVFSLTTLGTILFAGTAPDGVMMSLDGGNSWQQANSGLSTSYVSAFAVSGSTIYAGTIDAGVYRSNDSGKSWIAFRSGFPLNVTVNALLVNDSDLFAGTDSGGCIFRSSEVGNNWSIAIAGMAGSEVTCLAASGMNLVAGTWSYASGNTGPQFLSTDLGDIWKTSTNVLGANNFITMGGSLFAASENRVLQSTDNGASWKLDSNGLPSIWFVSLATDGKYLFAGGGDGVYRSSDNGSSWTSVNAGLTNNQIYALAMIGTELFAGTQGFGVFRSTNFGNTWIAANNGIDSAYVMSMAVLGQTLFVGADGDIPLFRSDDSGTTWKSINMGFPKDSGFDNTCVFSDGANLFVGSDNGFFFSSNGGSSWVEAGTGLPVNTPLFTYSVISFTELGSNIFVGTDGRGVWQRPISDFNQSGVVQNGFVNSDNPIGLFPNPASSNLQILGGQTGTVHLFDIMGRERMTANDDGTGATLDVSHLEAGTYFLRLGNQSTKVEIAR